LKEPVYYLLLGIIVLYGVYGILNIVNMVKLSAIKKEKQIEKSKNPYL